MGAPGCLEINLDDEAWRVVNTILWNLVDWSWVSEYRQFFLLVVDRKPGEGADASLESRCTLVECETRRALNWNEAYLN